MSSLFRKQLFALAMIVATSSSVVRAGDDDKTDGDKDNDTVSCVNVKAEARYSGVGYNHLVHLDNQCTFAAQCEVSTNVNKDPQTVNVPSKEKRTVLTWRGSPAREFTPYVVCIKRP